MMSPLLACTFGLSDCPGQTCGSPGVGTVQAARRGTRRRRAKIEERRAKNEERRGWRRGREPTRAVTAYTLALFTMLIVLRSSFFALRSEPRRVAPATRVRRPGQV